MPHYILFPTTTGGGGGGSGTVVEVIATNGSIVVSGTPTVEPSIATGTLDAIAADEPAAASVTLNSQKITNLANGSNPQDAVAFGQLAAYAPLASPALTGAPTAPTQTPLTNNTDIATTAYTDLAVGVETTRAEAAEASLATVANYYKSITFK